MDRPVIGEKEKEDSLKNFLSGGFQTQHELLDSQADLHEEKAMDYLRKTLKASAEVSPSQGVAAALLAAIPTFGGYMIGKSVGAPDLSAMKGAPVGSFEQFKGLAAGGAYTGGMQGAKIGESAGLEYMKNLEADKAQENESYSKLAGIEMGRAAKLQAQDAAVVQSGLNARADIELQRERDKAEELPPEVMAQLSKELGLPEGQRLTASQLRAYNATIANKRLQEKQDFTFGQSNVPGYESVTATRLTPTTAAELQKRVAGTAQTKMLLGMAAKNPTAITGQEGAVNNAIAGMLMNAQRLATGSGAQFTEAEMSLIQSATPALAANNLSGWLKQNALGRDQAAFAQTLIGLYDKVQDYALLEGYGLKRADVGYDYYPPQMVARLAGGQASTPPPSAPVTAPPAQSPALSGTVDELKAMYSSGKITREQYVQALKAK